MASPLQAGEFEYGLGYVGTRSDNISHVPTGQREDWINSYLAGFAYQENSADLVAHILAQGEFDTYRNHTYNNQSLYYLDSDAVWTISPQRFTWTAQDTARQILINPTAVNTPTNQTHVNVLSTGPDVLLRFSPVQSAALGARAGYVYTGSLDNDSKRFNGTAGWLYQSSSETTYSLNYQPLVVRFNNSTLNDNFTQQDSFVRGDYHPALSQYVLDLGVSKIHRDFGKGASKTLARFTWNRELTPESAFGLTASRDFSDTGTDILAASQTTTSHTVAVQPPVPNTVLSSNVLTSDVYFAKREQIFYNRHSSEFGAQFTLTRSNLAYLTNPLDSNETDARLQLDYFYSEVTTASVFTEYTKTKYLDLSRNDTDKDSGILFGYRLSRTLSLGLEARHTTANSTDPSVIFKENRIVLSLLYSTGSLFTPVADR
ncbi:MAG: hypothetical protein ACYC9J_13830 [Sulfuricaulis sp.]